jgi:hypothetical protein
MTLGSVTKTSGTLGGVKKSFITACEKAGILQGQDEPEEIIFHDTRRTITLTKP